MSDGETSRRGRWRRWTVYGATVFVTAVATILVVALLLNIDQRKREARQHYVQLAELTEETVNPAIWGLNFPSQY